MTPLITLVVATAKNGCIGINNDMPWHIPEDFAFFKAYTSGKPVVMGRKTWESLPKKPLPNRRNIVISRNQNYVAEGAEVVDSLQAALSLCAQEAETIIMGGAQIYAEALPLATDLRITEVDLMVDGDAFFPSIDKNQFVECERLPHVSAKGIGFDFVHYHRQG
ncbi:MULTISPECIES: dihydrofolate reductase [Vitreoscilla]|uniref:Dihydrofolate reductase n=1 Tax=Vitreoscilla stercoraria TaxID=61 RepID=A0ABY4E825_VITST|nr:MULTISPECIES: dihydrofolate reductase [Vitreoscilla]AUZ04358.1 dihydrofolate reductase [Vitreoscilla sp. C1]UOO91913.1 dihydrofolate reductase [Vitreoscilla stercoraria]